jgi:creatinine amidohydrolase
LHLVDLTADAYLAFKDKKLILPIGSVQNHGPHLPIGTDTFITDALISELVRNRGDDLVIAPTMPYSSSRSNSMPALQIPATRLTEVLRIFSSNLSEQRFIVVSAHGENMVAFANAGVPFWTPRAEVLTNAAARWQLPASARGLWTPDSYAGRTETSIMLALRPETVSLEQLQDPQFLAFRQAVDGATAEEGLAILAALAEDLITFVDKVE